MSEVEVIGEVDTKGRVTIPKKLREEFSISPKDKVKLRVVGVMPRKSFVKECKHILKEGGDAVDLMHRESPLRVKFKD